MKKVQLLLVAFIACSVAAVGQTQPTTNTSSTTTTASNMNANSAQGAGGTVYSADLFTGTASVNIPIHDYSIDGLNLGVSLSYNTCGIKVDQVASSEGLGWTLNVGGSITREVVGVEDELTFPYFGIYVDPQNNNQPILNSSGQYVGANVNEMRGSFVGKVPYSTGSPAINYNIVDNEEHAKDKFTAVFGGKTVEFIIEHFYQGGIATKFYTSDQQEVKIEEFVDGVAVGPNLNVPLNLGQSEFSGILTFTITDEKGNKYQFDRGDYEKRTYTPINSQTGKPWAASYGYTSTYYVTTKWVLTKITTYSGAIINYTYTNFPSQYFQLYQSQKVRELNHNISCDENCTRLIQIDEDKPIMFEGRIAHISKINYPNGTVVDFNTDNDPYNLRCDIVSNYALKSIKISNGYDANVKNALQYKFNYSYMNSPSVSTTPYPFATINPDIAFPTPCNQINMPASELQLRLRLKLNSIVKVGLDGTTQEPYYSFNYNHSHELPARLSYFRDYYGFYTNATILPLHQKLNSCLAMGAYADDNLIVPLHTFNGYTYGALMTPNLTYGQTGILTDITNGMGGKTTFYYEDHQLTDPGNYFDGSLTPFGGLSNGTNISAEVPNTIDFNGNNANDGLRLQKVSMYDGYNHDFDKTVSYTYSGGQRFQKGPFFWYPVTRVSTQPNNVDDILYHSFPNYAAAFSEWVQPWIYGCNRDNNRI